MERVTKKEMVLYFIIIQCVLIIIALIICFISIKTVNSAQLINQISLISGISSITLSLVAIIYAFFQTYDSSKQNQLATETLMKVSERIDELVTLKTDVADLRTDLSDKLGDLLNDLNDAKDSVEKLPANKPEGLQEKLESMQKTIERLQKNNLQKDSFSNIYTGKSLRFEEVGIGLKLTFDGPIDFLKIEELIKKECLANRAMVEDIRYNSRASNSNEVSYYINLKTSSESNSLSGIRKALMKELEKIENIIDINFFARPSSMRRNI